MQRVLIVEDERAIADVIEYAVRSAGFVTRCAASLAEARRLLHSEETDLLVLDLGLPDGDGLDLCRELRRASSVPVLMLTCRDEEADRVRGLELGADDYVVKPFSPRELVARIRSILRRSRSVTDEVQNGDGGETLRHGRLALSLARHRLTLDGTEIRLTPVELRLLATLLRRPARVHSRSSLIDQVHGPVALTSERTIDSHVKSIRRKLGTVDPSADPIETVFGVGYRARKIE